METPLRSLRRPGSVGPILALWKLLLLTAALAGQDRAVAALPDDAVAELRALRADVADIGRRLDRLLERHGDQLERPGQPGEDREPSAEERPGAGEVEEGAGDELVRVDVRNTDWMKEVLFGGHPWVLHCIDGRASAPLQTPAVLRESARELRSMASFGLVDCWERMESGKTLAHRFDFPKPPVTFAVANGDPPAVIDLEGAVKPWQVRRKAGPHLAATIERIDGPARFKQYCTNRRACLVVGFKTAAMLAGAMRALPPLLERARGVRAVAVDTSVWKVKLDDKLAATKPTKRKGDGAARAERADLLCLARINGGSARGGAFFLAPGEDLDAGAVEEFLGRCEGGRSLVEVTKVPSISERPPEVPKPVSPSAKPAAGKQTGADSKARGARGKQQGGKRGAASSRADVVGSRQTLEEDEPTVVSVHEDEAEEMQRAAKEEEEDSALEEVEL